MASIRALERAHIEAAARLLDNELGGRRQARLGQTHDVLAFPGFGAWDADALVGVATYAIDGDRAELAAIAVSADHRLRRIGSELIDAVTRAARSAGVHELWLVTTNDNVDALRLYQRREFRLTALRPGAVDQARALKPTIPTLGRYGIQLRDELVLTLRLVN
jgi:ribosomal protein S18 acetylase RimI-like enzyme